MADNNLDIARKQYADIKIGFDVNKSLQYNLGVEALQSTLRIINTPDAIQFVDKFLYQIVNILLDQSPSKIGPAEKNKIVESLTLSIEILIKLLGSQPHLVTVLSRVLEQSSTFYAGSKTYYHTYPGYPYVRTEMAAKFANMNGFQILYHALFVPEIRWPGAGHMLNFAKAMNVDEAIAVIHEDMKAQFVEKTMAALLNLTDDQLKKESCDAITSLLRILSQIILFENGNRLKCNDLRGIKKLETYYLFWFGFIVRLMNSNSLVLKLFAWDVAQDLVSYAIESKPFPKFYAVEGAQAEFVNGIYNFSKIDKGSPVYERTQVKPNEPIVSLLRFSMKDKTFRWFLSTVKPGAPDIDYYEDMTTSFDRKLPSMYEWSGVSNHTKFTPPIVKRYGSLVPDGVNEDALLGSRLCKWACDQEIISQVFGQNMHREIIARSDKLLVFMANHDAIRADHIHLIWKAAFQNSAEDVIEEVWALLAGLTIHLDLKLFQVIVDLALSHMNKDEASFLKVAAFAEKFSRDQYRYVQLLQKSESAQLLLNLMWEIYKSPFFPALKATSSIQDLLSRCLNFKCGNEFLLNRIKESAEALTSIRTKEITDYSSEDEIKASQIILNLLFLTSKQIDESIVLSLTQEGFAQVIILEIERFITSQKLLSSDQVSTIVSGVSPLNTGIEDRLNVLRRYFGLSSSSKIKLSDIDNLSDLLSKKSNHINEFLHFLWNGGQYQEEIRPFCDDNLFVIIFQRFICSDTIDWTMCDDRAFHCFIVYFSKIKNPSNDLNRQEFAQIQKLGLDTLWRIAMTIPSEVSTKSALEFLLGTYDDLSIEYSDSYGIMLNTIFTHLLEVDAHSTESSSAMSDADYTRVDRCIGILHEAILRSKADSDPSHTIRGIRSRIMLKVYHKKVNSFFNYTTRSEILTPVKGSEGSFDIDIHPMHTVAFLKKKVMDLIGFNDSSSVAITFNKRVLDANERLVHAGLVDGSEISVTCKVLTAKYATTPSYDRDSEWNTSSQFNVGLFISNDKHKFDVLLTFTSLMIQRPVAEKIWEIIMLVPTKFEIWHQIFTNFVSTTNENVVEDEDSMDEDDKPIDWIGLCKSGSLSLLSYYLQIVDNNLQPAQDCENSLTYDQLREFRRNFINKDGFKKIVEIFLMVPSGGNFLQKEILGTALHIIHFCLFYSEEFDNEDNIAASNPCDIKVPNPSLLNDLIQSSTQVVEKLLKVAGEASTSLESSVVQDSLALITALLRSKEVAATLINNPQSKELLGIVLQGASRKVRALAADFAVQFGMSQPVVFKWLLSVLDNLLPSDDKCSDIFRASLSLLSMNHGSTTKSEDYEELGKLLSNKLLSYCSKRQEPHEERLVLHGFLELLAELILLDVNAVMDNPLGKDFFHTMLSRFLFALPNSSDSSEPICDNQMTKQAAFKVLLAMVSVRKSSVTVIISHIDQLCKQAASHMMFNWEVMLSQDVKRQDIEFLGLKNQGCTCYSNSFLQQLFMNESFRNAIMMTPLLEHHRTTLWHKSNEDLVGCKVLFEFRNNTWHVGEIMAFDPITKKHSVQYLEIRLNNNGNPIRAEFNIREGRKDLETGRIRLLPPEGAEPIVDREEGANRVLEQLQRAFCFLQFSKKRFYDPRPLVEACRTLNLNFDVYHQNDAAEFCDQLLDRIETATKGKFTSKDIWNDVLKTKVFGGNFISQKVPQDCDTYQSDKKSCGHWQSSLKESFLKIELIIRGKENIDESLRELVQGELMDGDNKINCDVCTQKKATVRRTCIENLPNTLIVHLKRFDLDFQTFETVKLNSKLEFPIKLNVLKYTKDGLESEERKAKLNQPSNDAETPTSPDGSKGYPSPQYNTSGSSVSVPSGAPVIQYDDPFVEPDASDYEYELQGVLVHSGVAQGGHYYSFIKDPSTDGDKWFRFDDDDVSPFSADQIPYQCFGGPNSTQVIGSNFHEDERTSNALMLFYKKVKSTVVESPSKDEIMMNALNIKAGNTLKTNDSGLVLVNGYEAYAREVHESNLHHVLSCYLLDSDLHMFVRDVLSKLSNHDDNTSNSLNINAISSLSLDDSLNDSLPSQTFQFSVKFLFDIILHCRERSGTKSWQQIFQQHFENFPSSAKWLLKELVASDRTWLKEYLLYCSDFMSRSTFVHIITQAIHALMPINEALLQSLNEKDEIIVLNGEETTKVRAHIATEMNPKVEYLIVLFLQHILKFVLEVPAHVRTADEVFVLIRDLAAIPSIRFCLNYHQIIAKLCFFVIPESVHVDLKSLFYVPNIKGNRNRPDYFVLFGAIFEALASLLGVPQVRKINLLQDNRTYWERQLVPEAKDALTIIFQEVSTNGLMDSNQLFQFIERVTGHKPHQSNIKHIIESTANVDGKLTVEGFLQHYTDKASYAAKEVWAIFNHFGFRNDLSRVRSTDQHGITNDGSIINNSESLNFPDYGIQSYSIVCLMSIGLYEAGMESNEEVTKTIVQRVCTNNARFSAALIGMTTKKLFEECQLHTWGNKIDAILEFITVILKIDDNHSYIRVREAMLNKDFGFMIIVRSERIKPTLCRANDYDHGGILNRYLNFIQTLCKNVQIAANIRRIVEEETVAQDVRGILRLRPDSHLTEEEESKLKRTYVKVQDAGVPEVNGIYKFVNIMYDSGYYAREGQYQGKSVKFTIYRCNVSSGHFQWFISITPDNCNPGTTSDIDFYIGTGSRGSIDPFPPKLWNGVSNNRMNVGRAPTVTCMQEDSEIVTDSSNITLQDTADSSMLSGPYGRGNMGHNMTINTNNIDGRVRGQNFADFQPGRSSLSSLEVTQEDDSDIDSNTQQIDPDDIELLNRGESNLQDDDLGDESFQSNDEYDDRGFDER